MEKIKSFFKSVWIVLKKIGKSIGGMFKRLFIPSKVENEALLSPGKQVMKRFFRNKIAIIGMIGFLLIFLFSFGVSSFVPLNLYHTNTFHRNLPPNYSYLDVPNELKVEGIVKISSGASFSVGVSEAGKVYVWGTDNHGIKSGVPAELKNKKIVDVWAGSQHAMAMAEDGSVFFWGYNNFEQGQLSTRFAQQFETDPIVSLQGGYDKTMAITESGKVFMWGIGATNIGDVFRINPWEFTDDDENIIKATYVVANNNNLIALLEDGTIRVVGTNSQVRAEVPTILMDGTVRVIDIGITEYNAFALDEDGNLYGWGDTSFRMVGDNIPELARTNVKDIEDGYGHMVALTNDGKLVAWGENFVGQSDVPEGTYTKIWVDAYQNYALNDKGEVVTWGNRGFLLGSDEQGRDLLTQLAYGGRITLTIGAVAVIISTIIGVVVGLVSGYFGGWIDNVLMRVAEVISSFPFLPFAITLSALMIRTDASETDRMILIMVILGVLSWTGLARLIRGQILAEREKDYVLAARALGISNQAIIWKHIFPSVVPIVIVDITLGYAGSLLTEAGLSFLGFGVKKPNPSWGNILNAAQNLEAISMYWWRWILPGICLIIAALSVNLIGDALRDALDPKSDQ